MSTKMEKKERLRQLFREAYKARENAATEGQWRTGLMARIRNEAQDAASPSYVIDFEHLVWKLFPASLAMSVGLAVMLGWLYLTTEYNGLQLFVYYMETLPLRQIFGA